MELLTIEEMTRADSLAVEAGHEVRDLMERAGEAVARRADSMARPRSRIAVVCGPGNNGGDGFVAARKLADAGHTVEVVALADPGEMEGAARQAATDWTGPVKIGASDLAADLVVDALFGAGLSRPPEGEAAKLIEVVNQAGVPVVAVDVPSGLNGDTGAAEGPVVQASSTVTFFRKKPGHLLYPGRALCGSIVVAQIGIPSEVLATIAPRFHVNLPGVWAEAISLPAAEAHKYDRGHAVVFSGPAHSTGAARLAARGALRIGAGLVTVACPHEALAVVAAHLTAIMVHPYAGPGGVAGVLADERRNAVAIGPGFGVAPETVAAVDAILASKASVVLDADALTSFAGEPDRLFAGIRDRTAPTVLTPHEGEFARLFDLKGSKLVRALQAAEISGAVVVLKGPDTVIADAEGRALITDNAPPWLATAGSGDVLTGFITGLMAQGTPAFEAAGAGVWFHGEAAAEVGPGLIAEDLPEVMPAILRSRIDAAGPAHKGGSSRS